MADAPVRIVCDDNFAKFLAGALRLESFFPEFLASHVEKCFPRSGLYAYPDGYHVVEQGDRGRDIYVIYNGWVEIIQSLGCAAADLARLGPGDILGEIALLRDGVRVATAVAGDEAQIFRLAFEDMQYLLQNNPPLCEHLNALAAKRLGG
ncbi:MAG: cyclic nucleotide-binding domain-containing protein [Elusimicrobia bacterium]|nr:cyclic nucleotide-binding domain-containing protein [Elusimicrobiota bacterium]